jgi:hypothetical protein
MFAQFLKYLLAFYVLRNGNHAVMDLMPGHMMHTHGIHQIHNY